MRDLGLLVWFYLRIAVSALAILMGLAAAILMAFGSHAFAGLAVASVLFLIASLPWLRELSHTSIGEPLIRFLIFLLGIGFVVMACSVRYHTFPEKCLPFGSTRSGCLAENWLYRVGGPGPMIFVWTVLALFLIFLAVLPSPRKQT